MFPVVFLVSYILKELVDSPGMQFSHDLNKFFKKKNDEKNTDSTKSLKDFLVHNQFLKSIFLF